MCLLRSALISLFCKYRPACFILITPFWAPVYHYLLWSVSPAVLINIILAYFENVGACDLFAIQQHYFFFLKKKKKKQLQSLKLWYPLEPVCVCGCMCVSCCPAELLHSRMGSESNWGVVCIVGWLLCCALGSSVLTGTEHRSASVLLSPCLLFPAASQGHNTTLWWGQLEACCCGGLCWWDTSKQYSDIYLAYQEWVNWCPAV